MQAFLVELKNRPGEVAKLTEAISAKGINITGFTGAACGDSGSVCLITNDETSTRRTLQDAHYQVQERELVLATLPDRPGALAEATRRLANAGVNIEAAVPTGMSASGINVAFATDSATKARTALGDMATTGSMAR
jgi:hypothetical protein